jgi:lipid II:glycine glycyltransferase (peptidoglycan interpeptide bridge formation enzyme)
MQLALEQAPSEKIEVLLRDAPVDNAWDAFVMNAAGGNHLQTSLWAQVKQTLGWRGARLILQREQQILGGAQLLLRKVAPGLSICYLPRGPLFAEAAASLAPQLMHQILRYCRSQHCHFLAVQPALGGEALLPELAKTGFKRSTLELAPYASILIDCCASPEQLLNSMKRQTRQNVRRSIKDGITTRIGAEQDIPRFYQLYLQTGQRQGFLPYDKAYFEKMWEVFAPYESICIVFSEFAGEAVSGLLLIAFGDTVCAKLLGWSGKFGEHRPNDALFWAAIDWARQNGYRTFDFEGINREGAQAFLETGSLPEKFHHTPDFLKYGFGGQVTLFPEAYEYIPNPLLRAVMGRMDLKVGGSGPTSRLIDLFRKR